MKSLKILLPMIALVLVFTACTKENNEAISDEEAIESLIEGEYSSWFDFASELSDSILPDTVNPGLMTASLDTFPFIIAWGREITDVTKDITIHIENDTANVTIERDLYGVFHVVVPDSEGEPWEDLAKDLHDHAVRYARFVRTFSETEAGWRWTLDAISNVEIEAQPEHTVDIDSIRVTARDGSFDKLYTDPLVLWQRDSVPVFNPGDTVDVTLYPHNFSEIRSVAILHNSHREGGQMHHHRCRFTPVPEEQKFVGSWAVPTTPDVYHVGFDLLRWETFFVRDYPYDDNGWCFVYRVE